MPGPLESLKARFAGLAQKLRANTSSDRLTRFDPAKAMEWATNVFHGQDVSFYGKIATIVLCSYFLADLSAMGVGKLLPEASSLHAGRMGFGLRREHSLDDYNVVFARNLFNSNGVIPGEEVGAPGIEDLGGTPVRTTLPLTLIGTMIMEDEIRSIATIQDKTSQMVYPVREEDEIPSKAKILKIEPRRVVFLNESNHHREFVDLPENVETTAPRVAIGNQGGGIQQVAPTQFDIPRGEVDKALSNLNNILTQARAVPNFENGQPAGYKLFQIVPGSIYSQLGLVDGDVIKGFDGQPANDPTMAFEKLSNLKNTSHLDLQVERGGKQIDYSYDFK